MAGIAIIGNGGTVAEVESASRAIRTVPRYVDPGALGSYSLGMTSGAMAVALAANSPVFSFRWGNANIAVVRKVWFTMTFGIGFAAGASVINLIVARSFSASDTGGTGATLTTNNCKLRTNMGTTLLTDARIATTGTLTAGTRTLDAQPISAMGWNTGTTSTTYEFPLFEANMGAGEYPLVLAQNEGFVITGNVAGTGTWTFGVRVAWDELSAF
jgi:hypothetical protein